MKARPVEVSEIFIKNQESPAKIIRNVGGAGSTKSHSMAQVFIQRFISQKNKNFLVTRKPLPALRLSAYKLVIDLLADYGYYQQCEHNKSERTIKFNGNFMYFGSLIDPERIKSTEWDYIWMEEATDFTFADFTQLKLRLRRTNKGKGQLFLTYNPIDEHGWFNERLDKESNLETIHSTYKDNPFLSQDFISMLENLKQQDPEYHKIYTLGLYGRVQGLIYTNWTEVDEIPECDETLYALDFGFNNPTALIKIDIKDTNIYLEQIIYESGLTNTDLIDFLNGLELNKNKEIYADPAEPDRIEEIYRAGYNIKKADKAVKPGIDFVKSRNIYVLKDSVDIIKEKNTYKWKQDKNDNVLDEPVKFKDHAMDAIRYGIYTHLKSKVKGQILAYA